MSAPIRPEEFDEASSAYDFMPSDERGTRRESTTEAIGFVAGTRVATPLGYVTVERLAAGDRILTADGRHAKLIWVGRTRVMARGGNAPVRFETGVMDNIRPLRLGQGHRVRVTGWRAELLFDAEAVLATAKSFVNDMDVMIDHSGAEITYIHLMFERHEVVLAENVACETLRAGPDGKRVLDEMARSSVEMHHPEMPFGVHSGDQAVLPILTTGEEQVLRAA
jgi:hypothetical protein